MWICALLYILFDGLCCGKSSLILIPWMYWIQDSVLDFYGLILFILLQTGDSCFEAHERICYSRDQLLQLREVCFYGYRLFVYPDVLLQAGQLRSINCFPLSGKFTFVTVPFRLAPWTNLEYLHFPWYYCWKILRTEFLE